jgi:hypothetical protein
MWTFCGQLFAKVSALKRCRSGPYAEIRAAFGKKQQ